MPNVFAPHNVAMTRAGLLPALIATAMLSACTQTSDGRAVAGAGDDATATPAMSTESTRPPDTPPTSESAGAQPGPPTMGVAPTLPDTVPPNALVCQPVPAPGTATTVQIADPAAPRIVISLPTGWNASPRPTGATLTGPDGMSGDVEITETNLDPAAAFEKYADAIAALAPISSISLLPAENCGYSGQRMMGVLSGARLGSLTFADRVAHIWTNTKNYLVAIHVGTPTRMPGFDAATPVLLADYAITVP